jgi:outer membrane protein OmpA-like peptidoglycan-associated protein
MNTALSAALAAGTLLVPTGMVASWVVAAGNRLERAEAAPVADENAPVLAQASNNSEYCSDDLKKVLRRVLQSCGLVNSGRGCQPLDAKNVATTSGGDFNALFLPLADRAGIIQFDKESSDLDAADTALLDRIFADQKGASYFFVVARSSPEGSVEFNRQLSEKRGHAVLDHLHSSFNDPELDKEVGLLWLGEEVQQLDEEFCKWQRSGAADTCQPEELNRSAFIAWIDCRL